MFPFVTVYVPEYAPETASRTSFVPGSRKDTETRYSSSET